jgi:adenosylcobyric acid synthase
MARAQAVQAQACGIEAHVDMNPILLKPISETQAQVILHGQVFGTSGWASYLSHRETLLRAIRASYERLSQAYEVLVIEGAGSAAEVNLRDRDLANWPVVELADASVILVADIDRGGVFAQILGTLDLLLPEQRRRVIGVIVNKFRGDVRLFAEGVAYLEQRSGLPVLGVLPFLFDLDLDHEDRVPIDRYQAQLFTAHHVNVAVVLLPRMSNMTDFQPLAAEADVALRYVNRPEDLAGADVVILPGSKNTIADCQALVERGLANALYKHVEQGGELVGICGGYQILGRRLADPWGVEAGGSVQGLGLLEVDTELKTQKTLTQVEAIPLFLDHASAGVVTGYQIHAGVTVRLHERPCFRILRADGCRADHDSLDGAVREDGRVWGTYIHGLFDQPAFRRAWLNRVRLRKGLVALPVSVSEQVSRRRGAELDRWAAHMQKHLNLGPLYKALHLDSTGGRSCKAYGRSHADY